MIRFRLKRFAAALSVCAFSACAGTSSPVALAPDSLRASSVLSPASLTVETATATDARRLLGGTRLYVSNWNNTLTFPPASPAPIASSLSVFNVSHHDAPLDPVPVGPLLVPTFIALDDCGKIYVSNSVTQNISVFDTRHGNAELPSIAAGLTNPQGIAIDRSGKLYVADGNHVNVYDTLHGNLELPAIAVAALNAGPVALDASGKLYLASGIGEITVLDTKNGNAALPPIMFRGSGSLVESPVVEGMTVDKRGKLYVSVSDNTILVFDTRRANAPLPTITATGLLGAGMVVDEHGLLYVANFQFGSGNSILVFDTTNANSLIATLTGNGMEGVHSLALQPAESR